MVKWNRAHLSVLHTQGEHNREAIRMMKWNKKIILLNYVLTVCFYEFPFHFRFFSLYWPRTNTLLYLKQRCCQWRWQFQDLEVSSPEKLICMIILAILLTGWWISCNIKKIYIFFPTRKKPDSHYSQVLVHSTKVSDIYFTQRVICITPLSAQGCRSRSPWQPYRQCGPFILLPARYTTCRVVCVSSEICHLVRQCVISQWANIINKRLPECIFVLAVVSGGSLTSPFMLSNH